jgi:hypothetical protein
MSRYRFRCLGFREIPIYYSFFKKNAAESGGKGGSVGGFAWENVTEFAAHGCLFAAAAGRGFLDGLFDRFPGFAGALLNLAQQFIVLAFGELEIVIRELGPLLLQLAFGNVPVAFDFEFAHIALFCFSFVNRRQRDSKSVPAVGLSAKTTTKAGSLVSSRLVCSHWDFDTPCAEQPLMAIANLATRSAQAVRGFFGQVSGNGAGVHIKACPAEAGRPEWPKPHPVRRSDHNPNSGCVAT